MNKRFMDLVALLDDSKYGNWNITQILQSLKKNQ